jgi:CRP-like cAMP-binding protein
MRVIPYLHDFVSGLPEHIQSEFERLSTVRHLARGEAAYRKDDPALELFRLLEGGIKLCNYSLDGAEIVTGEFRPGDCFGDMGIFDGLPRVSHAIASKDSRVSVISKRDFDKLCEENPEIYRQLNLMMCRRVRFLYALNEESISLRLQVRLARVLRRLAYSHGHRGSQDETHIEVSHEELSNMLGASRQSVSKELKLLERQGDIELRYGKIFIHDLDELGKKYETEIGLEQVTPIYKDDA